MEQPPQQSSDATQYDVTTQKFRQHLEGLISQFNDIIKLTTDVAQIGKGEKRVLSSEELQVFGLREALVGRRELRSIQSQFARELKSLSKFFTAAKKPRRARSERKPFTGFGIPIFISKELQNFFRAVNLGPALMATATDVKGRPTESAPAEQQLSFYLQLLLEQGITARGMLTPLFNIYVRVNNMAYRDGNRTYLRATKEMYQFFGENFKELTQRDKATQRVEKVRRKVGGQTITESLPLPPFDPARFRYSDIMRILSFHWLAAKLLTEPQKTALADEQTRSRLLEEQQLVSMTNACYRAAEAPARKEERAARRKVAQPART